MIGGRSAIDWEQSQGARGGIAMEPGSPPEYVVATYEEIRERFGLGGTDQARIKAKRRGWPAEPRNDPGALARIRVPWKEWDAAGRTERSPGSGADQSRTYKALEGIIAAFREERDRLLAERDRERAEAAKAREELAALAVRVAVAETQAKGLRERAEKAEARADRVEEEARRPFWRRWLG